jgi:hypothetical protein
MTRPGKALLLRRALDIIRRTLRNHPELRERTADYLDGRLPEGTPDHDKEKDNSNGTRR